MNKGPDPQIGPMAHIAQILSLRRKGRRQQAARVTDHCAGTCLLRLAKDVGEGCAGALHVNLKKRLITLGVEGILCGHNLAPQQP